MTKEIAQELARKLAAGNYNIYLTAAGRQAVIELFNDKREEQNV
jgi:short-subunit dehydrogenase